MEIRSGDAVATIEREGGYISSLKFSGRDILLDGDMKNKTHGGCAMLFPYPNRIRDGKYRWGGTEYHLPINSPPNSIHGLLNDTTLEIGSLQEDRLILKGIISNSGYPSPVSVEIHYSIRNNSLGIELHAENRGKLQVPVAFGIHPYFLHGGQWALQGPEEYKFLKYEDRYFPNGDSYSVPAMDMRSESGLEFDSCFEFKGDMKLKCRDRVFLISGNRTGYYVIYNGKWCRSVSVALEPMTAAPDSYNNHLGIDVIEPGESKEFKVELNCSFIDQK